MQFSRPHPCHRPDAARVLDSLGRLRTDHPALLDDPVFAVRGRDGSIRQLCQSAMLKDQAEARKWLWALPGAPAAGTVPASTVHPSLPVDAGSTADFSPSPYMLPPFVSDQGTQRNLSDCYYTATLASFARLRPAVIWTAGKQLSADTYRTRFFQMQIYPRQMPVNQLDVVSDAVLPKDNYDDVGDDGSIWLKLFVRHYAYARTGANTYDSLNWGFAGQVMMDLGVFPATYAASDPSLVTTIMAALINNPCVVANSNADTRGTGIIPAHVYSVVAVRPNENPALTVIDLDNPWKGYGITSVRLSDFQLAFNSITVGQTVAFELDPTFSPFVPAPAPEPAVDYPAVLAATRDSLVALADRVRARRGG